MVKKIFVFPEMYQNFIKLLRFEATIHEWLLTKNAQYKKVLISNFRHLRIPYTELLFSSEIERKDVLWASF